MFDIFQLGGGQEETPTHAKNLRLGKQSSYRVFGKDFQ